MDTVPEHVQGQDRSPEGRTLEAPQGGESIGKGALPPEASGPIELMVQATGVNAPEGLNVTAADAGTPGSGVLTVDVKDGERCKVTVSFDEPYDGPIELIAISRAAGEETPA